MAVLEVKRVADQRGTSINNITEGTINCTYQVRTDDALDGPFVVLTATDPTSGLQIPPAEANYETPYVGANEAQALSQQLGDQGDVKLIRREVVQPDSNNPNVHHVRCTWAIGNPLQWPVEVNWDGERIKIGLQSDLEGQAITNSADDPYQNPPEVDGSIHTLTVVKNFETYDPIFFAQFLGQTTATGTTGSNPEEDDSNLGEQTGGPVNDGEWWDYPKDTVRLVNVRSQFVNGVDVPMHYYRLTFTFLVNFATWTLWLLDQGFREYDDVLGQYFLARDKTTGMPFSSPVLLDGSGIMLAKGKAPVFFGYDVYPPKKFDDLGIGPRPT